MKKMKDNFKYKSEHSLDERRTEADRILKEYPNRMPIVCECAPNSDLMHLNKTKFLVPDDMTVTQFQFLIRKHLDLNEYSALYLITEKGVTITGNQTMREIYNIHKDKQDHFLYLFYASELTWG